jgi:hypothetical protein
VIASVVGLLLGLLIGVGSRAPLSSMIAAATAVQLLATFPKNSTTLSIDPLPHSIYS